jgi:AmmeMemoRadiSam system protein B
MGKIRPAYCAGYWYNDDPKKLSAEISNYLDGVKKENFRVKAVIVPHAGYVYSGKVAAYSFKQIDKNTKNVIILGTAHRYPLKGVCAMDYDAYDSPLGAVRVDIRMNDFMKEKNVVSLSDADVEEHSIEIEIPFLQLQLKNFEILPLIVGRVNTDEFSKLLEKYFEENSLIVVSVDLSHFHSFEKAVELDNESIKNILELNDLAVEDSEIDSPYAVMSLIKLARRKNWKPKLLCYKNSGSVKGDKNRVVGYASIIFYENE